MPPIYLRNGYRIHSASAIAIWFGFREVMEADPGALYELVDVCRNEDHVIPRGYRGILLGWAMVKEFTRDGHAVVHDDVRAIVLSAVEGDDENMVLVEPWARPQPEQET